METSGRGFWHSVIESKGALMAIGGAAAAGFAFGVAFLVFVGMPGRMDTAEDDIVVLQEENTASDERFDAFIARFDRYLCIEQAKEAGTDVMACAR